MTYKLTTDSGGLISLESDIKEAERQARYFMRKNEQIEKIELIEIETDKVISTFERW